MVGVLFGRWSVVGFPFGRWSVVNFWFVRWSVVFIVGAGGGRLVMWSMFCIFTGQWSLLFLGMVDGRWSVS